MHGNPSSEWYNLSDMRKIGRRVKLRRRIGCGLATLVVGSAAVWALVEVLSR